MTTTGPADGDSQEDKPVSQPAESTSTKTSTGFFARAALAIVSLGLLVVSGFVFFSGDAGVAQPVATVLGGAGVFAAGVLTFRAAHNTRISAEETAAKTLTHCG
ncbi:hypothetical protein [Nocardia sp. 348MFTsu5.1]|uniref:hypothetical protein n=1 Tax=Nocardia sp. 348MFTsu5.1 TaxID=1172185 RepID=UPI0003754018|nr:hypothetical protein [Nocardia sp. 348MFTsu5.1]